MQAKPFKPLQFGAISLDRCVEHEGDFFPPARMFPLSTPEAVDGERGWMEPHFIKPKSEGGRMQAGLFAYVIRTGRHVILVDTCVGNDKPRAFSPASTSSSCAPWPISFWSATGGVLFSEPSRMCCARICM